ncbi:hypothetical protein MRX96_019833 [Rhipicephalus microplus]
MYILNNGHHIFVRSGAARRALDRALVTDGGLYTRGAAHRALFRHPGSSPRQNKVHQGLPCSELAQIPRIVCCSASRGCFPSPHLGVRECSYDSVSRSGWYPCAQYKAANLRAAQHFLQRAVTALTSQLFRVLSTAFGAPSTSPNHN